MEQFSPDEFTTDSNDGMSYFVDGWGHAINFLRWAPGFSSPLHGWDVNYYTSSKTYPENHDPFDPLHIYKPANSPPEPFYNSTAGAQQVYPPLYPLIYSPGPDRNSGIYDENVNSSNVAIPLHYANLTPVPNNPYAAQTDSSGNKTLFGCYIGGDATDAIDNITNHDIGEND